MSGRIFQNVVLQLKENTDRTVGVIDGEGIVIACSDSRADPALLMGCLTMQPSPLATTRSARPSAPWPRWR